MAKRSHKEITQELIQKLPENTRPLIITVILSIAAALSAVLFMFAIKKIFALTYLNFAEGSKLYFALASLILITVTSLIVGFLLYILSPDAAGSGIPQVKSSYWKEMGNISLRTTVVKFIAGVISIGGGNSLGREGPSVFIGSGVATNLNDLLGVKERNKRAASLIGASAGLAAAFNTPLAAISFVIEEIVGDFNNRYLGRVVISSVIGAFVVYALLGRQPSFSLPSIENISWFHYLVVPFVAFIASYFAILFQKYTLKNRKSLKKQKKFPPWLTPLFGGLITWVIGVTVFVLTDKVGIFGLGYDDLSEAMSNRIGWQVAGILLAGKLIATFASYSFGGCGGIFAPSLFIGAFCGFFLGGIAGIWIPLTPADQIVLAAVGMSAYLGALLHAPLTSVLIVFEMTHQFELVPALMIGIIISQAVAKKFTSYNFYEAILIQDGHDYHKIKPPVDIHSWQNLPISVIMNPKVAFLSKMDISEVERCLESYPYKAFPIIIDGRLEGILGRTEMENSIKNKKFPDVHKAGVCYTDQSLKDVGNEFIEYNIYVLTVLDRSSGKIVGIVTLRDLIRAQTAEND
jgi:chloride channel protein, CIC family